jgi:hypothetical protein
MSAIGVAAIVFVVVYSGINAVLDPNGVAPNWLAGLLFGVVAVGLGLVVAGTRRRR